MDHVLDEDGPESGESVGEKRKSIGVGEGNRRWDSKRISGRDMWQTEIWEISIWYVREGRPKGALVCAKTLLNEPAYFWVEPQDFLLLPCLELSSRKSAPSFILLLLLLFSLPRKNTSAPPVNAPLPPVVTLLATLAFIPESATTSAPSPVVRPVAPARTISSNSASLVIVSFKSHWRVL